MKYSDEPQNPAQFQAKFDNFYSWFATPYYFLLELFPFWKKWLEKSLPYISGPKVLEVSFGTGHLLCQYADKFDVYGVDLNKKMLSLAENQLRKKGLKATLQLGNVESLPYKDNYFDTVVNTMAFSGYPDGELALSEMLRVLKPQGLLILIDINYPKNHNLLGSTLIEFWKYSGDLVRNMDQLLKKFKVKYNEEELGGFGSVHLYLCTKSV